MLFVLDVGNTNMVLGVFEQDELKHEWRMKTDRFKTEDEFGILIHSLFEFKGIKFADIEGVVISSVVPPIMFALERMSRHYFHIDPIVINGPAMHHILEMKYPNPKEVGADRIVNAVSAIAKYGGPLIIIDFGTATTFCYIDEEEHYCGGAITPGINISIDALYTRASKLPKIELAAPDKVIGRSTIEAMQSGVFYGYIAQVDGMIHRIKKEMATNPKVIATGGISSLIAKESQGIDEVDIHLTLEGLNIIYHKIKDTI